MSQVALGPASSAVRVESARPFVSIVCRIFSFPVMLAGMLTLLAFFTVRSRFNDSDTWWHLRIGQLVWTTHTIPTTDLFSFTTHHHAWVPHEWLAQLSMFACYNLGGYQGLMFWLVALSAALLVAGYFLCTIYSGNAKTAFIAALTLWIFATEGFSPRPQLLGYLLMLVELILIQLGRTRSPRWFFALPPLFALWVNIHGSFSFGLIILAVVLGCSFLSIRWGLIVSSAWEPRRRNFLALAFLLSIAALALNPDGFHQILYPLDLLRHQPVSLRFVEEWQPLTIAQGRGIALVLTLACIALIVMVRRSTIRLEELLLLSLGTLAALQHQRMAFVFGILAAPILARLIAPLWDGYDPHADFPWLNAAMILGCLFIVWRAFPAQGTLAQVVQNRNPSQAVQYILDHHLTGPMLNAYGFGGYLIWALPEEPVFIDGRADVFDWTGVLADMAGWATLEDDPNLLLTKYHIHFCMLESGSPMAHVMLLLPGWKQVYADRVAIIFVRSS